MYVRGFKRTATNIVDYYEAMGDDCADPDLRSMVSNLEFFFLDFVGGGAHRVVFPLLVCRFIGVLRLFRLLVDRDRDRDRVEGKNECRLRP